MPSPWQETRHPIPKIPTREAGEAMYERLGEATLKSGEPIELGVVTAPDAE